MLVLAVATIFITSTIVLAIYGAHLFVLLWLFLRKHREAVCRHQQVMEDFRRTRGGEGWPIVTSQIPIYNEADVAARVIEAVAAMDYPRTLHEIQVLDDSTDHTRDIIDRTVERLRRRGVQISAVRRPSREGFKAGALAHGLTTSRGEFVAVFDADFVPGRDFLRRVVPPLVMNPQLACFQGRWDHINREESWLTRAQALGLDTHFAVEQGARAWNGLMMNFNGTAGVWRKSAILDARVGGWQGDTLTEDMDLSYRAQLAGWKLDYSLELACPAELPGTMAALKSQQRRWATGSIQTARKLLPTIWKSDQSLGAKLEATVHLTNHTSSVWLLILALAAKPATLLLADGLHFPLWVKIAFLITLLSAFAPAVTYAYARYILEGRWSGWRTIPSMFVLGSGLCLSNAVAVFRGLSSHVGEFVRTPKSGSRERDVRRSSYRAVQGQLWVGELALSIYSLASFYHCVQTSHYLLSFFLLIYAVGFGVIGWLSRPSIPTQPQSADVSIRPVFDARIANVNPAGTG